MKEASALEAFAEDYRILVTRYPHEVNRLLAERMGMKHKTFTTYAARARRKGLLTIWRVSGGGMPRGEAPDVDIARQGERNGMRGGCGARRAVFASASPRGRAARARDRAARESLVRAA